VAKFSVALWQQDTAARTQAGSSEQVTFAVPPERVRADGTLTLVITRLDAGEDADSVGGYSVVLGP
jgi:hypothetical protein